MVKSELVKQIPLKQILAISEVQLRELDKSYMETLRGFYEEEDKTNVERIPPIDVYLLQSGDPSTAVYAIVDGLHRYTIQKELKRKTVRAIVRTNNAFTSDDIGTKKLHSELIFWGMLGNAKNGKAFTSQQRKEVVIKFYLEYGATTERIFETGIAARSTIRDWLRPFTQTKKEANALLTKKALELKKEGKSLRNIALTLQNDEMVGKFIPENPEAQKSKLSRVLASATNDQPLQKDESSFCNGSNLTSSPSETLSSHEPAIDEALYVEEMMSSLCSTIQGAAHSEHLENRLREQFLPLLRSLCPTIDEICSDQGDTSEISGLRAEYYALYEQLKIRNKKIVQLEDDKKALKSEIASRTTNCDEACPHTYARLRIESSRSLKFLLERINYYIKLLPHLSNETAKVVKKNALEFILPALSQFETAATQGDKLTTLDTLNYFSELDSVLNSTHLTNDLINKRLKELRITFEKLGRQLGVQNSGKQAVSK